MQTQGAASLWGGSPGHAGLESNWGLGTPYSSGANTNLLGYSGNPGHMQSSASTSIGEPLNSNPILGNRGGWGATGTIPLPQSTNKLPTSSSGNVQGSLQVSAAQPNGPQSSQQSDTFTTSLAQGSGSVSSQGNSAFGNNVGFQKISSGSTSSGLSSNPTNNNSNSAQSTDNLSWGLPSVSDDSRVAGTNSWGSSSGAQWDQSSSASMSQWDQSSNSSMSQSQSQPPPSANSQFQNSNTTMPQSGQGDQQRPSSFAQAAGKGLNLQSSNPNPVNTMSPEELQQQALIRKAIESHDGWGKKPIRQDTQWLIETSPKVQRKITTASVVPEQQKGTTNMWNNNNGTAIWEANKDMSDWSGSPSAPPPSRVPGQQASNWPGVQQKPPEPPGGQWNVTNQGQSSGSEKTMGPWGGAPPTPSSQGSSGGQWSGNTETGSWGGHFGGNTQGSIASGGGIPNVGSVPGVGIAGGISTWGESDGASNWGDTGRNIGNNETNSFWSDPQTKPANVQTNWNVPSNMPPGQAAVGQNRKIGSNWGEAIGPSDPKMDDGTIHWTMGNQTMVRPPGWNPDQSNQGQWNQAIGKPNTKLPNPEQFGGVDAINWNLPKQEDVWSEENMGGCNDADMGTWNDTAQQTNSSWNSATGWNRDKRNSIKDGMNIKLPGSGGSGGVSTSQPQMRSRLIQHLMDMGFRRDDAQHALITNNMNLQNAISDLYNRRGTNGSHKDDVDMSRLLSQNGAHDDISDTQDSNLFVPNINHMQNTPFNNAQSKIPNQFPFSNGPSLNPSSLSSNNPSINPALQQKIIQKFQSQHLPPPPPSGMNSINPPQGPQGHAQLPVGQQLAQQHVFQQLRIAVKAGLINPQLLDQQLPAHMVLMLQQLLQHQQNLQQLITNQQMLQQPKLNMNPQMQRQQSELYSAKINMIKQQVLLLQKNILQAQSTLLKSQQQQPQQGSSENDSALQNDLNNLSISPAQPQSRLTQWRRSTPDKDSSDSKPASSDDTLVDTTVTTSCSDTVLGDSALNKAVGSKLNQQSNSTPNLRHFDELGLTQLGGDTTWSTSISAQNWPNTNAPTASRSIIDSSDGKHSLSSGVSIAGNSSVLDSIPAIPEFVPGKPWQGIIKSVEDDPHITPGSFSRSLSVNTIKDDYLFSLTKSHPSNENNSSWPSKSLSSSTTQSMNKPWSAGEVSHIPSGFTATSDVWGLPMGQAAMSRPPPPPGLLYQQQNNQQNLNMNRQHSWAGSAPRSDGGNWLGSGISLLLKNLTPQIDGSTLRTLCMQHGPLQYFYLNLPLGQALVKYKSIDEAVKAQKALNTCQLGNTTIVAELVSEDEAMRFAEKQDAVPSASQWSQMGHQSRPAVNVGGRNHRSQNLGNWGMQALTSSTMSATGMWGGAGNMGGNTGGLWDIEDNSAHNLLGNMLGDAM